MTESEQKQQEMEEFFLTLRTYENEKNSINTMIEAKFHSCNYETPSLTLAFQTAAWERNPIQVVHGGILCTFFDCTFGTLTRYLTKQTITTISLHINFLKPVQVGDLALVTAKANAVGKTIVSLTGELRSANSDVIAATATGTFMVLKKPLVKNRTVE